MTVPRATRSTLAQLRSGHCARLSTYLHRLGRADSDLCPECRSAPHTTSHLFVCPSHPTSLSVTDLWTKPWDAAVFLSSLPAFNFLPSPGPPPPPRFRSRRRPPRAAPPPPPPLLSYGHGYANTRREYSLTRKLAASIASERKLSASSMISLP